MTEAVQTPGTLPNESRLANQDPRAISVGLDIGTTKVVAIVGRKNQFGKVEVLGYGKAESYGVKTGEVINLQKTEQAIREAVRKAELNSRVKIERVTVGIAGQHIRSIQTRESMTRDNPESIITQEDIDKLTNQVKKIQVENGESIIHALPQEFKVDRIDDIQDVPIGMAGTRLEANFHVVVGKVAAIQNLIRCVKMAGLEVENITLEPLASSRAVLLDDEKEGGIALIDMGGGTTDLAIFKNQIIRHTAIIPAGGNIITQDLSTGIRVLKRDAELIKVKFGSAYPGENSDTEIVSIQGLPGHEPTEVSLKMISRIIKARVEEIIHYAGLEIKKYTDANEKNMLFGGIVLTGGGANMKHLTQLVKLLTGMHTRVGFPNQHLAGDSDEELKSPIFATAIGLLMEGLENKVNYEELEYEELEQPKNIQQEKPITKQEEANNEIVDEEDRQEDEELEKLKKLNKKRKSNSWTDAIMKFLGKFE